VHYIALPQVVGTLGFKLSAVLGSGCRSHHVVPVQKPVYRGRLELSVSDQAPLLHRADQAFDRSPRQLLSEFHQRQAGIFVHGAAYPLITAVAGIKGFEPSVASPVEAYPSQQGRTTDARLFRKGDLPPASALFPDQALLFARLKVDSVDQLTNDPESKGCNLFFVVFCHKASSFVGFQDALRQEKPKIYGTLG
jgi:hypothetical protein